VFGEDLKRAIMTARSEAHRLRHESVRPEHHALGVLLNPSPTVSAMLAGTDATELAATLQERAGVGTTSLAIYDLPYAQASKIVFEVAVKEARALGHERVGCDHLLLGLLQAAGSLPRAIFEERGVTAEGAREVMRAAHLGGAA
jgi:ATP-dependent Clp protease ATP-binding subunit ClpC